MSKSICDILRVEGVNAKGFGSFPKLVGQDRRLPIEAKAVYAYFISYAGAGDTAFPSVEKICYDLVISEKRYRKYLSLLVKYGYIKVEQQRGNKGRFENNIYTIVNKPEEVQENGEIEPTGQIDRTEDEPSSQIVRADENRTTENDQTYIYNINNNNNIYNKINSINNNSHSFSKETEEQTDEKIMREIRELESIIDNCQLWEVEDDYAHMLEGLIEKMYFAQNLSVNGSAIPQVIVRKNLKKLNSNVIGEIITKIQYNFKSGTEKVTNSTNYLISLIYNGIHEYYSDILSDPFLNAMKRNNNE